MGFDYKKDTKRYYQSSEVAEKYHSAFTQASNWRSIRFRIVASRERKVVRHLLRQVPYQNVLDLPSGTGKLAPLFKEFGVRVTACDISEFMIDIARREYAALSYENVEFCIGDAEKIGTVLHQKHFDVVVCLRLLHRVSEKVQCNILAEFSGIADYSIISFGIDSTFHRIRRSLRDYLFGGGKYVHCEEPLRVVRARLQQYFDIVNYAWVLPGGSQEIVFLLRPHLQLLKRPAGE